MNLPDEKPTQVTIYRAPFRFTYAPAGWVEPDYGMTLTDAIASAPSGCLGPQVPGSISRWMAVPWQRDTASCRSGYDKTYDPYVPAFSSAWISNQVPTRHLLGRLVRSGIVMV